MGKPGGKYRNTKRDRPYKPRGCVTYEAPVQGKLRVGDRVVDIRARNLTVSDNFTYDDEQFEFLMAAHAEKTRLKRPLTPAEILRVAKSLGYRKVIDLGDFK